MKRLTALILTLALLLSVAVIPAAQAASFATATVKGGWLRLRAAASFDAETLASYYTGTSVTILGGSGEWYHVYTPDGRTGYMNARYLTITGSITGGQLDENTQAYVTSTNGLSVRLRSGPSLQYSTIASYAVGTPVTILISGDTWCKVRVNGRTGYMMSEFLTTTPSSSSGGVTTGYTAYVTSANGLGVRLRTGPGKLYSTISNFNVGTQVTVLEYGKTWCKVRIAGVTGYMMTEFLTTRTPNLVTSVTLNASSAWVGETLYATVKPAGVTVNYEWLNDLGSRVGTGSTYTIRSSDIGRRIRVRVTGTGAASGSAVSGWATVSSGVAAVQSLTGISISDTTPVVGQTLTATIRPAGAQANISWFRDDGVYVASGATYTVHSTDLGRRLYCWAEGVGSTSGTVTSAYTQAVGSGNPDTSIRLTGVSISDTTPTVWQTLSATVSPTGAQANITWCRGDGTVIGTGATYTVPASLEGYGIYVVAEGKGSYTGMVSSTLTSKVTSGTASSQRIDSVTISDTTPVVGQTLYATVYPAGASAVITWYRDDDRILAVGSSYTVRADDAGHVIYLWAEGTGNTTGSATSRMTAPVTAPGVGTTTDLGW